ncbi:hypothetical protein FD755_014952, partial [Muntiacus reevesi]
KSFQETYQSDSEEWRSSKDLRNHLESLESELQFLSGLTGISIRNYCKKTEDLTSTEMAEKSIKKVLQRHRLSGNCHMITFQLEFQILEIQMVMVMPTSYTELLRHNTGGRYSWLGFSHKIRKQTDRMLTCNPWSA